MRAADSEIFIILNLGADAFKEGEQIVLQLFRFRVIPFLIKNVWPKTFFLSLKVNFKLLEICSAIFMVIVSFCLKRLSLNQEQPWKTHFFGQIVIHYQPWYIHLYRFLRQRNAGKIFMISGVINRCQESSN